MADGNPIIIGQPNTASNPGNETYLFRNQATNTFVFGVRNANAGSGLFGQSSRSAGVQGISDSWNGVQGSSTSAFGVRGFSILGADSAGVSGGSLNGDGVRGDSTDGYGVRGFSSNRNGVVGTSGSSFAGVVGQGFQGGRGVVGMSETNQGVFGQCLQPNVLLDRVGGYFDGGITVVNGAKNFKIDHPLDPENRYLVHNAVESSEMKNVYDGVAWLDKEGAAWVDLPEWFEALNGDFRYQLTAIGGSAPNLHVAEEVSENRFKIAGGEERMKVCWQVTGSRKDRWAAAHPFEVEQEKPEEDRGRYLDPSLYDAPEEQRVMMEPLVEAVEERPPEPSDIDFARLEEEHRRQIHELRRQEEEHRREMEALRRRMEEQQEEAPPEST